MKELTLYLFRGDFGNKTQEIKGLFGESRVIQDKNIIILRGVTPEEFACIYVKPCILRYRGNSELIALDDSGKFTQR